jgi:hypothetical protein
MDLPERCNEKEAKPEETKIVKPVMKNVKRGL